MDDEHDEHSGEWTVPAYPHRQAAAPKVSAANPDLLIGMKSAISDRYGQPARPPAARAAQAVPVIAGTTPPANAAPVAGDAVTSIFTSAGVDAASLRHPSDLIVAGVAERLALLVGGGPDRPDATLGEPQRDETLRVASEPAQSWTSDLADLLETADPIPPILPLAREVESHEQRPTPAVELWSANAQPEPALPLTMAPEPPALVPAAIEPLDVLPPSAHEGPKLGTGTAAAEPSPFSLRPGDFVGYPHFAGDPPRTTAPTLASPLTDAISPHVARADATAVPPAAPADRRVVREAPSATAPAKSRTKRHWFRTVLHTTAYVFLGWLALMTIVIFALRFVDPPGSMLMAWRALGGHEIDNRWVSLDNISDNLKRAVVVSEDGRFCHHWGIDPSEIAAAIRRARGGAPRGASTVTMQVAKNMYLWPSKSYLRKALEVPLTLLIELFWSKSRILEVYLNIAEWGPGVFGAEAAARHHFGKSVKSLSQREAALLAVSLPNPIRRDAGDPGRGTARLASAIQARMRSSGQAASCALKSP